MFTTTCSQPWQPEVCEGWQAGYPMMPPLEQIGPAIGSGQFCYARNLFKYIYMDDAVAHVVSVIIVNDGLELINPRLAMAGPGVIVLPGS